MTPYVIWSPPYTHKSAGIRALHRLAEELTIRGQQAGIGGTHEPPFVDNPFAAHSDDPYDPDRIHVYPEIVAGNPADSPNVVRWLLNRPHHSFEPAGRQYAWDRSIDPAAPRLAVNVVDLSLFHPNPCRRHGVAVYVGKGRADPALFPDGATFITRDWPEDRATVADILRTVTHLITFDPFSMLNLEATLCGTPVLVAGDSTVRTNTAGTDAWTAEQITTTGWYCGGMAWHPDHLDAARTEVTDSHARYLALLDAISGDVDRFIEETQAA